MERITVKGSWKEMGRALGYAQKRDIRFAFSKLTSWKKISPLLEKQVRWIQKRDARAYEHLIGMAEGSGESVERLIGFLSWEGFISHAEHCSSALAVDHGSWVIGHNEDDTRFLWRNRLWQVRYMPTSGVAFEGVMYPGQLPGASVGVNTHGFAIAMDNMNKPGSRPRVGDPISLVGFQLLQSQNWKEIKRVLKNAKPNQGSHYLIVEKSKYALSAEWYVDHWVTTTVQPGFAHTNHPIFTKTREKTLGSVSSCARIKALRQWKERKDLGSKAMRNCLRTPIKQGGAFQPNLPGKDTVTLATFLVRPEKKRIGEVKNTHLLLIS